MQKRHVLRSLVVSVAALLAFIGYEVFSTVFPSDAIVITASDGASLRVDGRALEILTGHAGTASFSPLLLPVATGLFAVLAVFGRIGAASLFRHERQTTHAALSIVLLLGVLFAGACASPARGPLPIASWSTDEAQILSAITASAEAWNRGDLKGHLAIYVDSVTFMTRSGPRPGVAAIEESFMNTHFRGGQPKQQLRFEQVVVRPLGRDAALQTGRFILSGSGEPEQSGWFTLVWLRTANGWRVVHDHSS